MPRRAQPSASGRTLRPRPSKNGMDVAKKPSHSETTAGNFKVKKRKIDTDSGRKQSARKKSGKLEAFINMPLDVVLEICSYLHPKDLLSLARSTKNLRNFFMSRNSSLFWKAARLTVTKPLLPPRPEDLCEPAYANLLFDFHCHNCLKPNCQDVYIACRVRLCKPCHEKLSVPLDDCNLVIDADTLQLIRPREIRHVLPVLRKALYEGDSFYAPQLESFFSELSSTPPHKREEYLAAREKLVSTLECTSALSSFLYEAKNSRWAELDIVRDARIRDIFKKLKEEGYKEELRWMKKSYSTLDDFVTMPIVRKSQPLTPRVWNNIHAKVIKHMEDVRKRRIHSIKRKTLASRLQLTENLVRELSSTLRRSAKFIVGVAVSIPEIYDHIRLGEAKLEVAELGRLLEARLPSLLEERENDIKESFVAQTRERLGLDESVDPFKLALAQWFTCPNCHMTLTLHHALNHQCEVSRPLRPDWMSSGDYTLLFDAFCELKYYLHPLPTNILTAKGTRLTEMVIEACGLDVKTATAADLDEADVWLQCMADDPRETGTPIMDWRTAAQHRCYHLGTPKFVRATEQQVSAAASLWDVARNTSEEKWNNAYAFSCAHCKEITKDSLRSLKLHLKNSHDVDEPTKDDYIDEHAIVKASEPVYLVKRKNLGTRWLLRYGRVACVRKQVDF